MRQCPAELHRTLLSSVMMTCLSTAISLPGVRSGQLQHLCKCVSHSVAKTLTSLRNPFPASFSFNVLGFYSSHGLISLPDASAIVKSPWMAPEFLQHRDPRVTHPHVQFVPGLLDAGNAIACVSFVSTHTSMQSDEDAQRVWNVIRGLSS